MTTRSIVVTIIMPATMLAVIVTVPLLLRDQLPDPLASHFRDGRPDEFQPLWPFVRDVAIVGVQAWSVMALLAYLRPPGTIGHRSAAGAAAGLTTLLALSVLLGAVCANLGAPDWRAAKASSAAETITLVGGVAAFVAGAVAVHPLRRREQPAELPPEPIPARISTRRGRSVWIGQARNPAFGRKTLAATCVMTVLAILGTRWMGVLALVSLASLHLWSGIVVCFDGRVLSVRGRIPLGTIRRIPLSRIETAEVIDVDPLHWGGWGWRMRSLNFKRSAVIVRKGEGLLVALRGGGEFIVTVDDAAGGAEEIRTALRMSARARESSSGEGRKPARSTARP